jgi:hypothetical protein
MVRVLTHKAAHTYGVLDPLMAERSDTKFVQGSLAAAQNIVVLPQGGYTDHGGTTHKALARRVPAAVAITSGMITNTNGGTKANLIDGDKAVTFVTNSVNADPFVLFTVDYSTPQNIAFIDLIDFKSATARDSSLKIQYHNGTTFVDFAPAVHLRTTLRTRRFARDPSLGNLALTQWRAVVVGGSGPGAITIGETKSWTETSTLSQTISRRYNYSVERFYTLVLTEGNCDIFRAGVWQAACGMESTSAIMREIKHLPSDDTVLFFHQDMAPQAIVRQGSDTEWQWGRQVFENVPLVDLGGTYTNGVNEKQVIRTYNVTAGFTIALTIEGEETDGIPANVNIANDPQESVPTATAVKDALEALPNVEPGLTVTQSGRTHTVEFTGGDNAGRQWGLIVGRAVENSNGIVTVTRSVRGKAAGEPIMSDARGWPAVGRFHQQRLILGGFKSRPKSWVMSVSGDVFNLEALRIGADAGRLYDLDDDDTNVIRDIHVGSTLMFFLDGSVWSMAKEALDADKVPRLIKSDSPGIDRKIRPISLDNALFYMQRGGNTLRSTVFSEIEQNFLADNASVLSAFLIKQPVDSALRRAVQGNDADLLFLPMDDGTMTSITLMRTQEVSGFAPHVTSGKYLSISVDAIEDTWLICERQVDGATRHCLELMEPKKLLDGAIDIALGGPTSTLTGLAKFNGQTVHVIGDGDYRGTFVVSAGAINLGAISLSSSARVGTWLPPSATDIAFRPQEEEGRPLARQKRNFAVELSLHETTSVAIIANGGTSENVPLLDMDNQPMDTPLSLLPFTGRRRIEGLPGFTETAQLTVTQLFPGRLIVRSVTKEIAA